MSKYSANIPPELPRGFPLSVFRRPCAGEASNGAVQGRANITEKSRLLIISNSSPPLGKKKKRRTKNRKYVSYSGKFSHNGETYKVNAAKSGIYPQILHKAMDQLEVCQRKWGRVLVIRFDLRQTFPTMDNKHISRFFDNLKRRLEREYGIREIGYLWVREQEKAKAQHYHVVIMLDGGKVRHSSKVLNIVKATWEAKPGLSYHKPEKPFYFVDNEEIKAHAIYRMSYLAKARGKGYRDNQVKDYNTSRLVTV